MIKQLLIHHFLKIILTKLERMLSNHTRKSPSKPPSRNSGSEVKCCLARNHLTLFGGHTIREMRSGFFSGLGLRRRQPARNRALPRRGFQACGAVSQQNLPNTNRGSHYSGNELKCSAAPNYLTLFGGHTIRAVHYSGAGGLTKMLMGRISRVRDFGPISRVRD